MSVMADVLARQHGDDYLWQYHRAGIIQICNDYIEYYQSEQSFSKNLHFSTLIEELVKNAHRDWLATWTPKIEKLDLINDEITTNMEQYLRKVFRGRRAWPPTAVSWPIMGSTMVGASLEAGSCMKASEAWRIRFISETDSKRSPGSLAVAFRITFSIIRGTCGLRLLAAGNGSFTCLSK